MRNKLVCLFCLIFLKHFGQLNLITNGGFETFSICPNSLSSGSYDAITNCIGWHSGRGSPDYFNSCSSYPYTSVPINYFGNQSAYSGNGYCGMCTYSQYVFWPEIITTKLTSTLTIGKKYFFSMKVSLAETQSGFATNKIGALFSTQEYTFTVISSMINNAAQVFSSPILKDSVNWVTVMNSFIADSAFQYINIGNFFEQQNTDTVRLHKATNDTYYFVDDVRLSSDSSFGLSVNMKEFSVNNKFPEVYPNPADDYFRIHSYVKEKNFISLTNMLGESRLISFDDDERIDASNLSNGLYYLNILVNSKEYRLKLVVLHR